MLIVHFKFCISKSCIEIMKIISKLILSPQPILTQCRTWLDATSYYAGNFSSIKLVLLSFWKFYKKCYSFIWKLKCKQLFSIHKK